MNLRALNGKLNRLTRNAVEGAAGLCLSRMHAEVGIEHYLLKLLNSTDGDLRAIARHAGIDTARLATDLNSALDQMKSGDGRAPSFNPHFVELMTQAWVIGSLDFGASEIRSGFTILALVSNDLLSRIVRDSTAELLKISPEDLRENFFQIVSRSGEGAPAEVKHPDGSESVSYAIDGENPVPEEDTANWTETAKAGTTDTPSGRDSDFRPGWPKAYWIGAIVGLAALVLAVFAGLSLVTRAPDFAAVGDGIIRSQVSLHREANDASKVVGKLNAQDSVEILQRVPPRKLDAWVLVWRASDHTFSGYLQLRSLERLKTSDAGFNMWHATTILQESAKTPDFEARLSAVDQVVQTTPLLPSPDTDRTYLELAKAYVSLAKDKVHEPDKARAAVVKAEAYLNRLGGAAALLPEADELRTSIQDTRVSLGDVVAEEAPSPPKAPIRPSLREELQKTMRDAAAASKDNLYARAAGLYRQVQSRGQGRRGIDDILKESDRLLREAEQAQLDYEQRNFGR